MPTFDPRLTPARADLAAKGLEGTVTAARFVEGRAYEGIEPQTALRATPAPDAPLLTEALKGERVTIYDMNAEGWAWGQLAADDYVGWPSANAPGPAGPAATPKADARATPRPPRCRRWAPSLSRVHRSSCRRSRRCRSARAWRSRASKIAWR